MNKTIELLVGFVVDCQMKDVVKFLVAEIPVNPAGRDEDFNHL